MKNIRAGMLVATKNSSYFVNLSLTGCFYLFTCRSFYCL